LVGDGSKQYVLPYMPDEIRKHIDLREITGGTLVSLLDGKFEGSVDSYEIIDCRYPYEYTGGHIKNAINLYTEGQIHKHFMESKPEGELIQCKEGRHIIIFHCEFSSQRGPSM
jgi:M-phase inducer phosphatase 2